MTIQPQTVVPGSRKVTDEQGAPMFDHKGRPLWNTASPTRQVRHFKSAGMRRKYEAGEVNLADATVLVSVYRGVDSATARMIRSFKRRKAWRQSAVSAAIGAAKSAVADAKRKARRKKGNGADAHASDDVPQPKKYRDPKDLTPRHARALVEEHGSARAAAAASGFTRDAIMRRMKKFNEVRQ